MIESEKLDCHFVSLIFHKSQCSEIQNINIFLYVKFLSHIFQHNTENSLVIQSAEYFYLQICDLYAEHES